MPELHKMPAEMLECPVNKKSYEPVSMRGDQVEEDLEAGWTACPQTERRVEMLVTAGELERWRAHCLACPMASEEPGQAIRIRYEGDEPRAIRDLG